MQNHADWREIYRTTDEPLACAIATTIASMEFDLRFRAQEIRAGLRTSADEIDTEYVLHVNERDWPVLFEVLDEIISEQLEFDDCATRRLSSPGRAAAIVGLSLLGAADLFAMFTTIRW